MMTLNFCRVPSFEENILIKMPSLIYWITLNLLIWKFSTSYIPFELALNIFSYKNLSKKFKRSLHVSCIWLKVVIKVTHTR